MRHGITRIHHQVHDDLFKLPLVRTDRAKIRCIGHTQAHLFANQPVQQMHQIRQHVLQRNAFKLQRLFAREREQLAHKRCRAVGVLADLQKITIIGILAPMAQQQKVAMARNRRQQVVEIMRNPARKLTDRLHFLALHELRFKRFQLCCILQHRQNRRPAQFHNPAQGDLQKLFDIRAMHTQNLGSPRQPVIRNIRQPFAHRPAKPFEQLMRHRTRCSLNPDQFARRTVCRHQRTAWRKLHQGNRQFLKIRQMRTVILPAGNRQQIYLPPLAWAFNLGQYRADWPVCRIDADLFAAVKPVRIEHIFQPLWPARYQFARRIIAKQHHASLVCHKHRQA